MRFRPSSSRFAAGRSIVAAALAPTLLTAALAALAAGCDAPDADEVADDGQVDELVTREGWSNQDDPSALGDSFVYRFDDLPTYGSVDRIPWPGSYWPAYQDSINYRWAGSGTRSPAEKYGLAFGKSGIEDAVSSEFGVDSLDGKRCKYQSDCGEGRMCARRRGEKQGRCAEKWFGICHAWAPAAILEPEPKHGVEYNGVRFEIPDIKALVSLTYTEALSLRHVSLRCDESDDEHFLGNVKACKDTNPGTFHVAITNLLGRRGDAFIMDRTYDYEVWNHPVIAYEITRDRQISPATANDLLGVGGSDYAFNDDAAELRRIRMVVYWVSASTSDVGGQLVDDIDWFTRTEVYDYVLELDDDGRVIGGEWIGSSRTRHPDFLWLPLKKHDSTVAGVRYSDVKKLISASQ